MRYLRAYFFLCKWKKVLDNTRLNAYNKDIPRRKGEADEERKIELVTAILQLAGAIAALIQALKH